MKHLLWLFLIWAFQQIALGAEVVKTKRMSQIEDKFGLTLVFVTPDKTWVYAGKLEALKFHVLPVSVPEDATDHDVKVALQASHDCAEFYEEMLKKETAPAVDSVFNMPTHPPLVILMPTHPRLYAWSYSTQGF
jgi:hypothetical protein